MPQALSSISAKYWEASLMHLLAAARGKMAEGLAALLEPPHDLSLCTVTWMN